MSKKQFQSIEYITPSGRYECINVGNINKLYGTNLEFLLDISQKLSDNTGQSQIYFLALIPYIHEDQNGEIVDLLESPPRLNDFTSYHLGNLDDAIEETKNWIDTLIPHLNDHRYLLKGLKFVKDNLDKGKRSLHRKLARYADEYQSFTKMGIDVGYVIPSGSYGAIGTMKNLRGSIEIFDLIAKGTEFASFETNINQLYFFLLPFYYYTTAYEYSGRDNTTDLAANIRVKDIDTIQYGLVENDDLPTVISWINKILKYLRSEPSSHIDLIRKLENVRVHLGNIDADKLGDKNAYHLTEILLHISAFVDSMHKYGY